MIEPVTESQARCASQKAMTAVVRLDPTKVSTNTDDNQAVRVMYSSGGRLRGEVGL